MRKSLLAVVTTTAAALLLTGCAGGVERVDGAAAPAAAPTPSATTTTAPPAPTTEAAPTTGAATTVARPTRTSTSPTKAPEAACPVTDAQLQRALKANPDDGVFPDSTFTKIVCYKSYAATTVPERSDSDESYVVFKRAAGAWTVLSSGTADICPGVPADVIKRFRSAHYGACR
jgi:hypothetical protein